MKYFHDVKKILFIVYLALIFVNNSLADTKTEEREFILYAKLPIVPKISILQISTNLLEIDRSKFELKFNVKTLNIVNYISNINGKGLVEGFIQNNNFFPESYKYEYVRGSKEKSVHLKYLNGKIIEEIYTPKFDKNKLTQINEEQKDNTIDPATFFLRLLDINKTSKCNQDIKIYDGKRRYDVIFDEKKVENQTIECSAFQKRIGGYKKNKIDPLTNTDLVKIRYQDSSNNGFLGFYAKKGLIEITIEEIN